MNWASFSVQDIVPFLREIAVALDVFFVYYLIYRLLRWIKSTHAFYLMRGMFVVFVLYLMSHFMGLTTLNWILGKFTTVLILLLIII